MRRSAATVIALTMVALAGCSMHTQESAPSTASSGEQTSHGGSGPGTVRGRLLFVGGPPPGSPRPATPGTVTLRGSEVVRVAVDRQGDFETAVDPGTYQATGTSPLYGSGKYLCRAEHPVVVSSSHTSRVDVYCQLM